MSDSKFLVFGGLIAMGLGALSLLLNGKKKGRELSEEEVRALLKKEGLYNFEDTYLNKYLQSFSEPGEEYVSSDTYFSHYVARKVLKDEKKRREEISPLDDEALDRAIQKEEDNLLSAKSELIKDIIKERLEMLLLEKGLRK